MPGVLRDMPEAQALAVTLGASAPVLPLTVHAVLRLRALASLNSALPCFCQGAAARLAPVGRMNDDAARAGVLTAPAAGSAIIPFRPLGELAVYGCLLMHVARAGALAWRWIARSDLLQVSLAEAPLSRTVALDAARAPHDAVARLRAVTPDPPVPEEAVQVGLARVGVADGRLPGVTAQGLPALVGHVGDLPHAHGRAAAAGGRARRPG
mmetsp:Transcript_29164/g.86730  ORF Transcript_29164/g.86730 Transcript_29164/m.86730 type:complete len:210 (+) Transcript_29164:712-1341(+)